MTQTCAVPDERGFPPGEIYLTAGARRELCQDDIVLALNRHLRGDWGELAEADREENELSLKEGFRLFSVYHAKDGKKFWIITEADRSATTVLMPEDY